MQTFLDLLGDNDLGVIESGAEIKAALYGYLAHLCNVFRIGVVAGER